MSEKSKVFSQHTFLFPFRWDYISSHKGKEKLSYSERTKLSDFDEIYSKCKLLKRKPFTIEKDFENYNEYTYFHEYVRRALYDTGNIGKSINNNEVLYYDLDGKDGDYFNISIKNGKTFKLTIANICLHIYSTGIGILSYNLNNTENTSKSDILQINEFGRRIYPQFIGGKTVDATKSTFMADRIFGNIGGIVFNEDFKQYEEGIHHTCTFLPPDHIKKVFGYRGQEKESSDRSFVFRSEHERKGNIRICKITDDRMFFLCYYNNEAVVNKLGRPVKRRKNELAQDNIKYYFQKDGFWYAYINGDKNEKDISIKNIDFQLEEVNKMTYSRWSNQKIIDKSNGLQECDVKSGVLFGMSRDSFVCVGDWFILPVHMSTMYYQMAILCLAQRASVLRFSYEVSLITDILEQKKDATRDINPTWQRVFISI